jgi:hypothetical protein
MYQIVSEQESKQGTVDRYLNNFDLWKLDFPFKIHVCHDEGFVYLNGAWRDTKY